MNRTVKLVLINITGLTLCLLVSWVGVHVYMTEAVLNWATGITQRNAKVAEQSTNQLVARLQIQKQAEEAQLRAENQAKAARLHEAARRRIAQQQLAASKNRAWSEWYHEPAGCDQWQSDTHMVECVNARMRARRAFEQEWAKREYPAATL